MAILNPTINADGTITLIFESGPATYTQARLQEMVAFVGTYYRELSTPYSAEAAAVPFQYGCLNNNPPVKVEGETKADREYYFDDDCFKIWEYAIRHELYAWISAQGLFELVMTVPTYDVANITALWHSEIDLSDQEKAVAAMVDLNEKLKVITFGDDASETAFLTAIRSDCPTAVMTNPFCWWIWEYAATIGLCSPDREQTCKPCCFHDVCHSSTGHQYLCQQLVKAICGGASAEECETIRTAAVAAWDTVATIITDTVGISL